MISTRRKGREISLLDLVWTHAGLSKIVLGVSVLEPPELRRGGTHSFASDPWAVAKLMSDAIVGASVAPSPTAALAMGVAYVAFPKTPEGADVAAPVAEETPAARADVDTSQSVQTAATTIRTATASGGAIDDGDAHAKATAETDADPAVSTVRERRRDEGTSVLESTCLRGRLASCIAAANEYVESPGCFSATGQHPWSRAAVHRAPTRRARGVLEGQEREAAAIRAKEQQRRERKAKKADEDEFERPTLRQRRGGRSR